MQPQKSIAVLCASANSIYHQIPGLEVFDHKRDARTFLGDAKIIAHPPCRGYSAFMRHWAKPVPGEKDLALFCTERICRNGGVLEHPKHSSYVKRFEKSTDWRILTIHQDDFGYPIKKATWLLMPAHYGIPDIPFELRPPYRPGEQKRIFENMSQNQRHRTTMQFAQWLIKLVAQND